MIGDTLKKERENQNLSVQDVEEGTSIRALYIEAIESGDYDKLPGEVYAKGFIKNYANFLNLDGDALVRQFLQEISPATAVAATPAENPAANPKTTENPAPADSDDDTVIIPRSKRRNNKSEENDDSRKYLIAVAAAVLLLVGGIFYGFSGSDEENPAVTQNEVTQPAENPQVAQVTPEPQPVAPTPANNVSLQVSFFGDCWTQVFIDGALAFEGMINAGQSFDWTGNQNVYVVLGNAGAAHFVWNGQDIGTLGEEGAVVDRNFVR